MKTTPFRMVFIIREKMRGKTACFTGHRKIPFIQIHTIKENLKKVIVSLIEQGYCFFGTGGALGFDTMAAQTILDLKQDYPQIKLILVLPCPSQANYWREKDKIIYKEIKARADKVVYIAKEYTRDCMFTRNRHLVDNSNVCICYLTERSGGTAYTVEYALKKGLRTINLAKM